MEEERQNDIEEKQKKAEDKTEQRNKSVKPSSGKTKNWLSSIHSNTKTLDKVRGNPWVISTIILGVIVLIVLLSDFGGLTGGVVSSNVAGEKLVNYLNTVADSEITLISVENYKGMYMVTVGYMGTEIPLYMTKDGSAYASGLVPIESSEPTIQEVPKSDKPVVDLFVMSYCPYGIEAQKILVPVMNLLKEDVDFRVRFVDYAMHGKKELDENLIQYCIQEEEKEKYSSYLECFANNQDSTSCLESSKIDKSKINSCVEITDNKFKVTELYNDESTWLSGYYPLFDVDKEFVEQFDVSGSETLIINGLKISPSEYRWSPENLKQLICNSFNDAPEICSQSLSEGSSSSVSGSCS